MKKIIYILIIVAVICLGAVYFTWQKAQKPEIETQKPSLSWVEVAKAADILKIEIVPYEDPTLIYKEWRQVRDYLAKKLNMEIQLRVARDYRAAINDIGLGVVDVAYLTPVTYTEARKDYCVQPLVSPIGQENQSVFDCLLIAREDSGINSVSDLRGKSFAYGDEKSTCGTLMAHKWLKEADIEYPSQQGRVQYFPNYNAVIQTLISGEFQAGAVRKSVFDKVSHPGIKIVKSEKIMADSVLVGTFDLGTGLKGRIVQALLEMDIKTPASKSILTAINPEYIGWRTENDEMYSSFKTLIKEIHGLDYTIAADYCLIKPKCKLAAKK